MTDATLAPAIKGWYTMDREQPHLIGTQCTRCKTRFFPPQTDFCRNPECEGAELAEVKLSRTGKIWSYTNACYQPPEPYVATAPFQPFTIAAVELDTDKMIVLGQVVRGVEVAALKVGMPVELVLETLYTSDEGEMLIWKWRPIPTTQGGLRS